MINAPIVKASILAPDTVGLTWNPVFGAVKYSVRRGGSFELNAGNVTSFAIGTLPPDTYSFDVAGVDAQGNKGTFSNVVSVTLSGSLSSSMVDNTSAHPQNFLPVQQNIPASQASGILNFVEQNPLIAVGGAIALFFLLKEL